MEKLCRVSKKQDLKLTVAQMVKRLLAMQETQVRFLGWEDLLEKEMTTHSSILLPREVHGQKSLVGYST